MAQKERIVFLDWLRVIACFMVLLIHSSEPFYLGGDGTLILSRSDALWVTFMNSPLRACVPLFVLASSYLLFPLQTSTKDFFKRRFTRIVVPFVIWLVVYAVLYGNLLPLPFNFTENAGHLWFMYMLLGLYLIMPVLSPWIEKASKKEEEIFLAIWGFTTLIPFIREANLAINGTAELWGEANWTEFSTFYYITGFVGYLVLGHYLKTYVKDLSWKKTLAIALPLWAVGYAIEAGWFWAAIPKASFPVSDDISLAVKIEQSWRMCSFGVALTVIAYFLLIRKITADGWFYRHIILPLSKASYGLYLIHIIVLGAVSGFLRARMCGITDGFYGGSAEAASVDVTLHWYTTPLCIILTAVGTFVIAGVLSVFIQKIPKVGKWLMG